MTEDKNWLRFIKSGKVSDYLQFVNALKENDIRDGNRDSIYGRGFSDKGNEHRGE